MAIDYHIEVSDEFSPSEAAALRRFDPIIISNTPRLLFTASNFKCIRGMRVTVGMIVGMFASGHSKTRLLEMYPYLEPEDIDQALEFASWKVDEREYDLEAV